MTKLETIAYYEAIGAIDRLITVDNTDTSEIILNKIQEKTTTQGLGGLHIEIFQHDKNITSYSLIKFSENIFDLWCQKDNQINKSDLCVIADFIHMNMPTPIKSPYTKFVKCKTNENKYIVHSFDDPEYEEIIDPKNISIDTMTEHILGQFVFDDGQIEYHCVNDKNTNVFNDIIDSIKDDNIRLFAQTLVLIIPNYVFEIPGGISGKYNSASALSKEGLLRNILDACRIYKALTYTDYAKIKFTQHEIDMMLVATLFCDVLKHGWQEDYETSHVPKYNHPKLMADVIRATSGILAVNELNFIANCIESHMGQFSNKHDTKVQTLPMPDTEFKYIVHLSTYLSSLNDIAFINNETVYLFDTVNVQTIKSYTIIDEHDMDTIKNALDKPIDMLLAKKLGINHNETDIIDVWKTILSEKQVSDKHLKYIELAKQMIFD